MAFLDEFRRMTGQASLPSVEEAVTLTEQRLYEQQFGYFLDALEEVAVEEDASEAEVRAAFESALTDEAIAAELAELYGGTLGGGSGHGSFKDDPTRAAYAKAFGPKAVAKAEKKARKKLSPEERKAIRSAAAKKAWETRKGKKGAQKPSFFGKLKDLGKKALAKVRGALSKKPSKRPLSFSFGSK